MSKSIHNKDWEDLIKDVDSKTKKALDEYDETIFQQRQKPMLIICSPEVAEKLNKII